jgi:thiol:disulfide interchange protein
LRTHAITAIARACRAAAFATAIALAAGAAHGAEAVLAAPQSHVGAQTFDPSRDAARDVADAVALAKASGRRVLVDVGGEWCVWCHLLDHFFATDGEALRLRKRYYVVVKVNWSPDNHNDAVLSRWPPVAGYPHLFVLDADGRLVHSQPTDVLEKGRGYDRDRIIAFLRRYAPMTVTTPG